LGTVLVISVYQLAYPLSQADDAPTWISTLVLTVLIIIFGETIPKITSKKQANKKALKYAYIIRTLNTILKPVVVPVVALVKLCTKPFGGEKTGDDEDVAIDELTDIIETAEEEKVLDEDASELVQAAIDFSDTPVYEVMTARVDMLAIDIEDDRESIDEIISNSTFTRIPVYEGSIDNIIGTLSLNRYLRACLEQEDPDIRSLIMPPKYVYKTTKLPIVLNEFRHAKQHLAVVTDEYGGTLGIVSMEDVLEAIVGDIWDESDEVEDEVVETSDGKYEFDGDTAIDSFLETLEMDEDALQCDSDTVGGWMIETLEHFPEKGESFEWNGYRMTVLDADDHRVSKVMAEKTEETE
jgi:CBS domain containing-hemolysin-like protein